MIPKVRRAYSAPSLFLAGGDKLVGMDCFAPVGAPPQRAKLAQNLWREEDGRVVKRPGIRLLEKTKIDGAVKWMRLFARQRFIYYENEQYGVLRREKEGAVQMRFVRGAFPLQMGEKLFIFCHGEWLVVTENKTLVITPGGYGDLTENFAAAPTPITLDNADITLPLIAAGGSPQSKGQGVLPPNLLTPLVMESFLYSKDDKEAKRTRFPLSLSPVLHLPPDEQASMPEVILATSAKLEVRLEKTDDFGNTVSYWSEHIWSAQDALDEKGAFRVHDIYEKKLCFDGEDNLRITYYRPTMTETFKLLAAEAFALYGVGGLPDRVFAAVGHQLFYSGIDDGLYFGSLQYLTLEAPILLLCGKGGVLSAFAEHTAWQIEGQAEKTAGAYALDAFFSVKGAFPVPRPYGKECFAIGQEILFYSENGLFSIHPGGVLDERTASERSGYLWGLLKEENPADIVMAQWGDYLILSGKKGSYLFDTTQSEKTARGTAFQGYFWTGIDADSFVNVDGKLCFFRGGNLYFFAKGQALHDEFLKDGILQTAPIAAVWESVLLGQSEHCGTYIGLFLRPGAPCMMRVLCQNPHGRWDTLYDYDGFWQGFNYADWRYGGFGYGSFLPLKRRKLMLRHRRGIYLRFENDLPDSPFSLERFAVEYK